METGTPLNEAISDRMFRRIQDSRRFRWRVTPMGRVRASYDGGKVYEGRSLCQVIAPLLAEAGIDPT